MQILNGSNGADFFEQPSGSDLGHLSFVSSKKQPTREGVQVDEEIRRKIWDASKMKPGEFFSTFLVSLTAVRELSVKEIKALVGIK